MDKNTLQFALSDKNITCLHYLFSLAVIFLIAFILTTAFYLQIVYNEIPCPLCLLQRIAFLGICFAIMLNLRMHHSIRHEGLTLLITIILLIISTRQTLLDIYPRPGHEYIGTTIFGLHMPVWSIVISVLLLLAYSLRFIMLGYSDHLKNTTLQAHPILNDIAIILMWYIITLCALNLLSAFLQCGLGSCHTFGYKLLS